MSSRIDIERYAGERALAIEHDLAQREPVEIAAVLDDLGVHLLLQSRLRPRGTDDDQRLARIRRELEHPSTDATFAAVHTRWPRRLLVLLLIGVVVAPAVLWWHSLDADRADPAEWAVDLDQTFGSDDRPVPLSPVAGIEVLIDAGGRLHPPTTPTGAWQLERGRIAVEADLPPPRRLAIRGTASTVTGGGTWTLSAARFRDRLTITTGDPVLTDVDGRERPTRPGEIWDVASGGYPRRLAAGIAARLPLHLAAQTPSADLVASLQPAGASATATPGTPLELPFMAPPAYDVHLEFERVTGRDVLAVVVPRHQAAPTVLMLDGRSGSRHGFNLVGDDHDRPNPSAVWTGPLCPTDRRVVLTILVRPDLVAAYLDGDLLAWATESVTLDAADHLAWPRPTDSGHLTLHAYRDRFRILGLGCRIHPDGIGANASMYGPQVRD